MTKMTRNHFPSEVSILNKVSLFAKTTTDSAYGYVLKIKYLLSD